MIKIGIAGAGGYAGINLINLLLRHPQAQIKWLMSEDAHKGKDIAQLYPHLLNIFSLPCQTLADLDENLASIDLVFLALPHGLALQSVPRIVAAGKKVVDLGADYRFDKMAVYGLPELYKKDIIKAQLIGNPGCYPTASILGLAPLVVETSRGSSLQIDLSSIVVDAKSGISGAGRGVGQKTHFCERQDGIMAYSVANHRHMGEIEYQVTRVSGDQATRVTFVPHLMPMTRGILATIYGKLIVGTADLRSLHRVYQSFYKDAPFVRIREKEDTPCTKYVVNTNYCDIGLEVNENTGTVIVMSCIDNLIKGAAGQAVQNMNLMNGFDEKEGLSNIGVYP